jgi:hypothetical protein
VTPEKQQDAVNLAEDIDEDLKRIADVMEIIEKDVELLQKDDRAFGQVPREIVVDATAGHLHAFYTGLENIYERIIIFTDGKKPTGQDFHKRVLETVRQTLQLTDTEENRLLDDLRGFRHLFRKAYGLTMDPERVVSKSREVVMRWSGIRLKITTFQNQLRQAPQDRVPKTE